MAREGAGSRGAELRLERALGLARAVWARERLALGLPPEALALGLLCPDCGEARSLTFELARSQPFAIPGAPLYRDLKERLAFLDEALRGRPEEVEAELWEGARRCPCGTAARHVATASAELWCPMPGSGAALVVERRPASAKGEAPPAAFHRLPLLGVAAPVEAASLEDPNLFRKFDRPLDLFSDFFRLFEPRAEPPSFLEVEPEPGLTLRARRGADPGGSPEAAGDEIVVRLRGSTLRASSWPPAFAEAADALDEGRLHAALVARRGRLEELCHLYAATLLGAELLFERAGEPPLLRREGLSWPLPLEPIALMAARLGRTLFDCALVAVREAGERLEGARALLAGMAALRPGLRFEAEGLRVSAIHRDGRRGRPFRIDSLPLGLDPASPEAERELRFFSEDLPAWSDPGRCCPCGAPAFVSRRLLSRAEAALFEAERGEPPAVQAEVGSGVTGALAALVVGCDRHLRFLGRSELRALDLADPERQLERLRADLDRAAFVAEARIVEDGEGRRAVLARGKHLASLFLEDAHLSSLLEALGGPLRGELGELWIVTGGALFLGEPGLEGALASRLVTELAWSEGLLPGSPPPFNLKKIARLDVPPRGAVAIEGAPAERIAP